MEEKKKISAVSVILIVILCMILIALISVMVLFALGSVTYKVNKQETTQVVTTDNKVVEQNTKVELEKATYSISDVAQINDYLKKIYSYYQSSIPEFDNINSANQDWLWSVAFYNSIYHTDVAYSLVEKQVKELFGSNLTLKLPKANLAEATYSQKNDSYTIVAKGGKLFWPMYAITNIEKTSTGFNVTIAEYVVDRMGGYGASPEEAAIIGDKIYLCKSMETAGTKIKEFKLGDDNLIEDYVLEHKDQFSSKLLTLIQDSQTKRLYISSSKNIVK